MPPAPAVFVKRHQRLHPPHSQDGDTQTARCATKFSSHTQLVGRPGRAANENRIFLCSLPLLLPYGPPIESRQFAFHVDFVVYVIRAPRAAAAAALRAPTIDDERHAHDPGAAATHAHLRPASSSCARASHRAPGPGRRHRHSSHRQGDPLLFRRPQSASATPSSHTSEQLLPSMPLR